MYFRFKYSIIGGTFDHLHKGHKSFLDQAFEFSEKVTIGLTTNEFASGKALAPAITGYNVRKRSLEDYLKSKSYIDRAKIVPIHNIFGISLQESNIDAIFVTDSGYGNALLINEKRKKKNFQPLTVVSVDLVEDTAGNIISSTNIRLGEIDREGNVYSYFFTSKKEYFMPESMRENLKKPFGEIIDEYALKNLKNKFIIAVGDMTVISFLKNGITPDVCIYDGLTNRARITNPILLEYLPKPDEVLVNNPGTINCKSSLKISKCIKKSIYEKKPISIKIEGEEDLLAIPSIIFAPLEAVVCYGLRDAGIVRVSINEEIKKEIATNFLKKFD